MTILLDGSVLIALTFSTHVHHEASRAWLTTVSEPLATTPITQGTLLRTAVRLGASTAEAFDLLLSLTTSNRHVFWPDDLPYSWAILERVVGHADVTDAYLVSMARDQASRLATLDRRLAALYPALVDVVPT